MSPFSGNYGMLAAAHRPFDSNRPALPLNLSRNRFSCRLQADVSKDTTPGILKQYAEDIKVRSKQR